MNAEPYENFIIIEDDLVKQAMECTGIKEKTKLIHAGLLALLEHAARKKLIALGGKGNETTKSVGQKKT